jgi:hypothetical protein
MDFCMFFLIYFRDACIRGKEFYPPVFLKCLPRPKVTQVSSIDSMHYKFVSQQIDIHALHIYIQTYIYI